MANIARLYNFGDIVGFIQDEINDDDANLQAKIKRYINRFSLNLNERRHPIFDKSATFATVNGTHIYTLSGSGLVKASANLSVGNCLAPRIIGRPDTNGWGEKMLTQKDMVFLRAAMPNPAATGSEHKGAPSIWVPFGVTSAMNPRTMLYYVPDAAANMPYIFTQRLVPLSAMSARNLLTVNHPELLIKAGTYAAWKTKKDLEQAAIARADLAEAYAEFWNLTKGETEPEGFTTGFPQPFPGQVNPLDPATWGM